MASARRERYAAPSAAATRAFFFFFLFDHVTAQHTRHRYATLDFSLLAAMLIFRYIGMPLLF